MNPSFSLIRNEALEQGCNQCKAISIVVMKEKKKMNKTSESWLKECATFSRFVVI